MSIHVSNINVSLSGQPILSNINIEFKPGQLIGLIGPNGAGKSTLLRVMAGLQMVQEGYVSIQDHKLQTIPQNELAKKMTYLAQSIDCHWPINVERLVMLGRHPYMSGQKVSNADIDAVEQAINDVDIAHLVGRQVNELSGGERARVMLARALATGSDILLADEPIVALDPKHQIEVMALLQTLASKGKTVIVVLHELHLAMRYCQQLVLLDQGKNVAEGLTESVLTDNNLKRVYDVDAIFGSHEGVPWVLPWSIKKGEGS